MATAEKGNRIIKVIFCTCFGIILNEQSLSFFIDILFDLFFSTDMTHIFFFHYRTKWSDAKVISSFSLTAFYADNTLYLLPSFLLGNEWLPGRDTMKYNDVHHHHRVGRQSHVLSVELHPSEYRAKEGKTKKNYKWWMCLECNFEHLFFNDTTYKNV